MSMHLHSVERGDGWSWLYAILARPGSAAWSGMAVLFLIGWGALGAMLVDMVARTDMATAGPGMAWFNRFSDVGALGALGADLLRSICSVGGAGGLFGPLDATGFAASLAMWMAMAFAMMVPSAVPLVRTYLEIAETARARSIAVVSPLVLIAGYLAAWMLFAITAVSLQSALAAGALLTPGLVAASPYLAAGVLALAGAYQFTPLKAACLRKCRQPFAYLFANWSDRTAGVFRIGMAQGVLCVACCWALMLVMFAVGLMNVIWIVLLAAVMLAEKLTSRPQMMVRASGTVLLAWSLVLVAGELV